MPWGRGGPDTGWNVRGGSSKLALARYRATGEAAKRGVGGERAPGVTPHRPGAEQADQAVRARQIAGPEAGHEPVVDVVRQRHCLLFSLEPHYAGDRPEDLLLHEAGTPGGSSV